jgi:energy-coupling factor transporter ATP-binding protein EcfA2
MNKKIFSVAEIVIEINGSEELCDLLANHFLGSEIMSSSESVDLIMSFSPIKSFDDEMYYYSLSGKIGFNNDSFFVKGNEFILLAENLFGEGQSKISIYHSTSKLNLNTIKNIILTVFSTKGFVNHNNNVINSLMSYSSFYYVFHLVLLKKEKAFIHASVASVNGKGILITGTSGCGKTSTLFELLSNISNKFIAEDFGIISNEGFTYYNPKMASIYNSDIAHGNEDLINFKKNIMSSLDTLLWWISIILKRNPLRRVSPLTLLSSSRIERTVKLDTVYFFQLSNNNSILYSQIDIDEGVERMLKASFRELRALYELLYNIESVGYSQTMIGTFDSILNRTRKIYIKAIRGINIILVSIPKGTGPQEILSEIGLH